MKKVRKGGGGTVNIWSLKEKISGMTFANSNNPALNYGREMEIEAVNTFAENFKNYHQVYIISECGLVFDETMPYIGEIPDRLMSSSCCCRAFIEKKCPYSIIYTESIEQNLNHLYLDGNAVNSKQSPKYFTQCIM